MPDDGQRHRNDWDCLVKLLSGPTNGSGPRVAERIHTTISSGGIVARQGFFAVDNMGKSLTAW